MCASPSRHRPYLLPAAQCRVTKEMKEEITEMLSDLHLKDADGKLVSVQGAAVVCVCVYGVSLETNAVNKCGALRCAHSRPCDCERQITRNQATGETIAEHYGKINLSSIKILGPEQAMFEEFVVLALDVQCHTL